MGYPKIGKNRMEAFSDGVLAIIITITVLEFKVPHGKGLDALQSLVPIFLSYVLSFVYVAIYWNNHHHMIHTTKVVSGSILWANLHLLFWLSLIPFATGWMGENQFSAVPVQFYGVVLLLASIAYGLLQAAIIWTQGEEGILKGAIGVDWKGKLSPVLYIIAIIVANWVPWLALVIYTGVAMMWIVPDPRIEKLYRM
jgi:uncharacterized membrane protein